jgi:hypothetical protein
MRERPSYDLIWVDDAGQVGPFSSDTPTPRSGPILVGVFLFATG